MAGLGQIIGGALSGLGDGMEKQAVQNDQDQRQQQLEEATAMREQALAALQHGYRMDETAASSAAEDQRDANHQARQFAYGTQENKQKQGFEQDNIRLKGAIDLSNDQQIEALKQRYQLTDIQVKAMADLNNQLAVAGQTADHWAVTTDGRMVAFNKQGKVLARSQNPNSFVPTGESVSDSDGLGGTASIAGEAASRGIGGGTPAPATKPTGQTPSSAAGQGAAALAQLGNIYAQISANPAAKTQYQRQYPGMFDANGNLLPKDVLIERVKQRYGA